MTLPLQMHLLIITEGCSRTKQIFVCRNTVMMPGPESQSKLVSLKLDLCSMIQVTFRVVVKGDKEYCERSQQLGGKEQYDWALICRLRKCTDGFTESFRAGIPVPAAQCRLWCYQHRSWREVAWV